MKALETFVIEEFKSLYRLLSKPIISKLPVQVLGT